MKRFFFAGMAFALCALCGHAFAQNNGGYTDDVYYNASQAEKDAQQAAEQSFTDSRNDNYYNSSGQDNQYDRSGAQAYNDDDNGNEYIDYDDDSYTMRMRRFYYPMSGIGYWGSVYSPYWNDPFFYNPYYSWGGWYTPGFSLSFGYGPYWSSGWGCNMWYGYGGFNSWYYPYYPYYGYGYGSGYWNGYYAGLYDGGYGNYYAPSRGLNYGPRGARNQRLTNSGNYGSGRRMDIQPGRTVTPLRGTRSNPVITNQRVGTPPDRSATSTVRENSNRNTNTIQLREGSTRVYDNNSQVDKGRQRPPGRRGLLRGNQNNMRVIENNSGRSNYNSRPARTPEPQRTERSYTPPQRTYSAPERSVPSRSYSAPSRGSSGGSVRGGGRR